MPHRTSGGAKGRGSRGQTPERTKNGPKPGQGKNRQAACRTIADWPPVCGPAGGETALDGMARAAYRVLRIAENMAACASLAAGAVKATPICVTALAAAYVNGAAGVCRTAVFRQAWAREPLWSPGCARLFAAALGNLLANAVQYGGERPAISVRAQKCGAMLLLTVADSGDGYGGEYGAKGSIGGGMKDCAKYGAENGASDSIEAERQDPVYSMGEEAAEDGRRGAAVCGRLWRAAAYGKRAGMRRALYPVPAAVCAGRGNPGTRSKRETHAGHGRPVEHAENAAPAAGLYRRPLQPAVCAIGARVRSAAVNHPKPRHG